MPLLRRYALARPNARSSHTVPTPQGAGIAVVAALLAVMIVGATGLELWRVALLSGALIALALVGGLDDVRPLGAGTRLILQTFAVAAALTALPEGARILPEAVPIAVERALLLLAGVYVVNITNFMDGLDWMTVAEMVPFSVGALLLAAIGAAPAAVAVIAAGLLGAHLGFAPFNRPGPGRFKVFLGDVGSLPIGLAVFVLAVLIAREGHLAPAVILGLTYITDATLTLIRRAARGARVWEAHREHFYQRATAEGLSVGRVVARVGALNVVLVVLAVAAALLDGVWIDAGLFALAVSLTVLALLEMVRPRQPAG